MKMSELWENPTILEWLDNLSPGENTQKIYFAGNAGLYKLYRDDSRGSQILG